MAFALLAVWALQARARLRFAALVVLTLAASPLAFLLLALLVAGTGAARLDTLRRNWGVGALFGAVGLVEIVLWRMFPDGGHFPFSALELAAAIAFCGVLLVMTWRVDDLRVLRFFFGIYAVAILTMYVVPSAIGENIARLRFAAIPLVVLVFSLRRWQPRLIGIVTLALAISWNVSPLAWSLFKNHVDATAHAA